MPKSYIPCIISLMSVLSSLIAIKYALYGYYTIVIQLIILAAVFDAMDGWFARRLNSVSIFGAEMDSLCDAFSFGFAPSICLYFWFFSELRTVGWILCFFVSIAMIIRLARFNTFQIEKITSYNGIDIKKYFIGLPAPAFGILTMLPVAIINLMDESLCQDLDEISEFKYGIISLYQMFWFKVSIVLYYCTISYLAISKIPFIAIKNSAIMKKKIIISVLGILLTLLYFINSYILCIVISFAMVTIFIQSLYNLYTKK